MSNVLPTVADVKDADVRLRGWLVDTPVLESEAINARAGARVLLKAECLQHTGSFKIRGALNRLLQLAADRAAIAASLAELQASVEENGLDYVPVFGYSSLRTDNHRELGLPSQADVVPGRDVVDATLPGFDVGAVASTVYRGTPEHPGAVAGLNPHCGEHGLMGQEDDRIIAPVVASLRATGLDVTGPIPGDTVFVRAVRGEFDAVVACYHDQGLIPVKLLAFGSAVNVSLGLPIVRTSVDHGTAFDIAGQDRADASSLVEAVVLAARLARGRKDA